jgi:hypothetical protein
VRRYETNESGDIYPTKEGVFFTPLRFSKLLSLEKVIAEKLKVKLEGGSIGEFKVHIGGGLYVCMNDVYKHVNLRLYWLPADAIDPIPTKMGVTISAYFWSGLMKSLVEVRDKFDELKDVVPCDLAEDHQNQLGYLACKECSPFGERT